MRIRMALEPFGLWHWPLQRAVGSRSRRMSGVTERFAGAPGRWSGLSVPPPAEDAVCLQCGERCFAPRWYTEFTDEAPRAEWRGRFVEEARAPGVEGPVTNLFWLAICAPTCRANAAVRRFEAAKREAVSALEDANAAVRRLETAKPRVVAALEAAQAAMVDAIAELGDAQAEIDR